MPVQGSLFPDEHEIFETALVALRDLDLSRARRLLERARRIRPHPANLGVITDAVRWLGGRLRETRPSPENLASSLLAVREQGLAGSLARAAAEFVDQTIARYAARHVLLPRPFLDAAQCVHQGLLDLILGRAATARRSLGASLRVAALQDRADLWGYLGDACWILQRRGEASAAYTRALLLGAADVDLLRVRARGLAQCYEGLLGAHDEACAREMLLPEAWIAGVVDIPPQNGWLEGRLPALRARAAATAEAPEVARCRRFALLLFLDRSRPTGEVDLAEREAMERLAPALFARYMAEWRKRQRED